ncbi:MAG: hypothetical protein RLZZ502_1078, partial [Pseudomonadota bacterium]
MYTAYRKDDKAWLAIAPEQLEKPMIFNVNMTHGIGERNLYGNLMFDNQQIVVWRKINPTTMQLVALNATYGPKGQSPAGIQVERMFSDSLLFSVPIVSTAESKTQAVLIDLSGIVFTDYLMAASMLERAYRQNYVLDARNSQITTLRSTADQLVIATRAHYATPRLAMAMPGMPAAPGVPAPSLPTTLPDPRSLFLGFSYNFAALPKEPMAPRLADQRIGHFVTNVEDYSDHSLRTPRLRYVNRWRLEKKDPNAAISEPKEPIVFWLDKNIPDKYREPTTRGILWWNDAFEKIGFKNAIVVKQQTKDDDFDTSDLRHASVRWIIGKDVPFGARGPSITDPRSGEILDADIEVSEDISRIYSTRFNEDLPKPVGQQSRVGSVFRGHHSHDADCNHAEFRINEIAFGLDLLAARGELDQQPERVEALLAEGIADLMAHEVGHTLGLRHNFRASTIYTAEQISNSEHTKTRGLSGSVMDYNAMNLSLTGEKQGHYFMQGLGPYDYWAIEYAYRELPRATENTELAKIAARSNEPALAYDTDENAGYGVQEGVDPGVNRSDLTGDPLAFYSKRFAVVREMWQRLQNRQFAPGESQEMLRRNVERGFAQLAVMSNLAAKYVGGLSVLRDRAGSGRAPLMPIAASEQRRALKLLAQELFSVDSLAFTPEFVSRLAIDPFTARDAIWAER